MQECHVPGPTPLPRDVDRFVFFTDGEDPDVAAAARQAARAEQKDRAEKLVYRAAAEGAHDRSKGCRRRDLRVARDEDRLKMAFMTGA